MSSETLTNEQRSLIEAKRKKALQCLNRNVVKSSSRTERLTANPIRQPLIPCQNQINTNETIKTGQKFLSMAQNWTNKCDFQPTKNTTSSLVNLPKTTSTFIPNLKVSTSKTSTNSLGLFGDTAKKNAHYPTTQTKGVISVLCVLCSTERFEVHSRYHAGLTQLCKTVPSKMYDPQTKTWSFSLSDYKDFVNKVNTIKELHLEGLPAAVMKTFRLNFSNDESKTVKEVNKTDLRILKDRVPDDLVQSLFPFQRDGVCMALNRSGRVLLADDMGLGKTVQSLTVAAAYRSDWPLLIVSPSSVRFSWRDQIIRWLGESLRLNLSDITVVVTGRDVTETNEYSSTLITIISYDLLGRYGKELLRRRFGVVIMDESHFMKNIKAARTKAAMPILKWAKRVLLLSGTPAMSRPAELFPQISAVAPDLFQGGFHEFGLRYCAAKECPWGWDYSGCSNMTELQLILEHSVMIRRVKADVLTQLPPKRRELVVLDPGLIKKGRLERHAKAMLTNKLSNSEKHSALLEYFHETGSVKIAAIQQYILDLIEAGRKFLLYAHHSEVLNSLDNLLGEKSVNFIRIDGRTNSEQRAFVCQKFQRDENCRVALLSITAAGTGINLTAANLVVFAELFWNPGVLVQAEDRAYRIGQLDSVLVRYLIAEKTADDFIWPLVERKLEVLSKAGLNRETFRNADSTRLGSSSQEQQTILQYFNENKLDSNDNLSLDNLDSNDEFQFSQSDWELINCSINQIEQENEKQSCKFTNLLNNSMIETQMNTTVIDKNSAHLLIPSSPEINLSQSTNQLDQNDVKNVLNESDKDDENSIFTEIAIAAELDWFNESFNSQN